MNRYNLALSCAFGALIAGTAQPASAQSATPVRVADASAPTSASSAGLEEIIITAQKVRTDAQKTPIAIQLIRGDAITTLGVTDAKDLNRLVSALSVQNSGGAGTSFYIRGVGSNNGSANNDNAVAVNLDQMYFSRAYGPDLSFYDLDRIEVLKGPQGTLYGRNATGGVINIISVKPDFEKASGYARAEFGNYSAVRLDAAVNVPLSETIAVRGAFHLNQHDGYLTDGYNDARQRGGRLHIMFKPTSTFSVLLTGEYDHGGGKGGESVLRPNNQFLFPDNPYVGGGDPRTIGFLNAYALAHPGTGLNPSPSPFGPPPTGTPFAGTPRTIYAAPGSCFPGCLPAVFTGPNASPSGQPYHVSNNGYADVTTKSLRGDIEWDLGPATLSVVPTYLNTYFSSLFYLAEGPFYNNASVDQESLEVRLASPQDKRLSGVIGLFGQIEKQNYTFIGAFGAPNAYQSSFSPDVEDHAYGVFAQARFIIVPNLTLTAGARYSTEKKEARNSIGDNTTLFPPPPPGAPGPRPVYLVSPYNSQQSSSPTYRVGLDWLAAPRNLLYASFATGFHSGGLQLGLPPSRPLCNVVNNGNAAAYVASVQGCDFPGDFLPEHLDAYTIGSKNRFFNNQLQVNVEIYDWEYTNLQVGTLATVNPGQTNQRVQNAGKARVRGIDLDLFARLGDNDEFGFSANYNESKYGQLSFVNYIAAFGPGGVAFNNLTGQHFVNAPDFTFTSHYQHVFNFAGGASLIPLATAQYSSTVLYNLSPLTSQEAYVKIDLALTFKAPHDRFEVQAFARNVNNVTTLNSVGGGGLDVLTQLPTAVLAPPRTFGGSLRVNF